MPDTSAQSQRFRYVCLGALIVLIPALALGIYSVYHANYRGIGPVMDQRAAVERRLHEAIMEPETGSWRKETLVVEGRQPITVYVRPNSRFESGIPVVVAWPPTDYGLQVGTAIVVGFADGRVDAVNGPEEWHELFLELTASAAAEVTDL